MPPDYDLDSLNDSRIEFEKIKDPRLKNLFINPIKLPPKLSVYSF
jgi:hypothetical protein